MSEVAALNLITDAWIPVRRVDGSQAVIRPDEIADPDVAFPDWPRADLNVACLELLIGLVFLADPPADKADWKARRKPDPARLREKLAALAPAFNLLGAGPRFLQDFELLTGDPNGPDMLFIDSAGGQTARNNADLMVRRARYPVLELPLAAMALYTLQAHAPSGGKGNRTSMRGGGPLVTMVDPGTGSLWDLVWANVPYGQPAGPDALPWMKPTRTSENDGSETRPQHGHPSEALFGMPRRLKLVSRESSIIGVIQRPYGVNYADWLHPLTPYYRVKPGTELLPLHPRAGAFGYRNWLGVILKLAKDKTDMRRRATAVDVFDARAGDEQWKRAALIIAGWSMDNMKPRDFVFSRQPLISLGDGEEMTLQAMIEAAETFGSVLRGALKDVVGSGSALDIQREAFFIDTQRAFEDGVDGLLRGEDVKVVAAGWVRAMERVALRIFDDLALPGLDQRPLKEIKSITDARDALRATFAGWRKPGPETYGNLGLQPRERKKKREEAA